MKNHSKVNGSLLQTNKKWSHLKEKQRNQILETTIAECTKFVTEKGNQPRKSGKEIVFERVMEKIHKKDIWIPYDEAKRNICKCIDRFNKRYTLNTSDDGEVSAVKKSKTLPKEKATPTPKTTQIPKENNSINKAIKQITELPAEIKDYVENYLKKEIGLYILQTTNVPPNKIRDTQLKQLIKGYNVKKFRRYGKKIAIDGALLDLYDNIRQEQFHEYQEHKTLPIKTKKQKYNERMSIIVASDRLILRPMTFADNKDVANIISDPDVMHAWERVFSTKQDVHKWIEKQMQRYKHDGVGYFLAIDKRTNEVVGQIGLMKNNIQDNEVLEVGYILKKDCWGKGYAVEGAKACIEYGFNTLNADKIYATIRTENQKSIDVAERLSMNRIGEFMKIYEGKEIKHLIYILEK